MIRVELISIGDELLIGQTVNTNASWLGSEIAALGIKVDNVQTISDKSLAITQSLELALSRSNVVLITGGLGPTKDDITKHTLASFFQSDLHIDENVLKHVTTFFEKRNRPMLEVNRLQALVPDKCTVLFNEVGTAPGMLFEMDGKLIISMPGVPFEMKYLFSTHVVPEIKKRFTLQTLYQRTAMTQGIGESFLADVLTEWENKIRSHGLDLAYLPSPGMVKLRVTADDSEKATRIDSFFNELSVLLPKHVYSLEEKSISEVLGDLLRKFGATVGTVESCTGGKLASTLVKVSGASDYFQGSLLTYSNLLKSKLAKVNPEIITAFGAVSEETVKAMAEGGREQLGVDWCISTSGIAGPTGGSKEKPVGTVWIGLAGKSVSKAWCFQFGDNRDRTMEMTCLTALNLLRCELLGLN